MYNKQLEAFIKAAELGSFSKAATELFITPSSLIQQINLLEKHLEVCLFTRSARGVALTPAGASIYEDAKNMVHLSAVAIERAKALQQRGEHTVRVGTSLFTKCRYLTDIWSRTAIAHPEIRVELVAQKSIREMTSEPLQDMGNSYDLQEGIYLTGLYEGRCNFFKLLDSRVSLAIPSGNPLFQRKELSLEDLRGTKLMLAKRGHTAAFDAVRDLLEQEKICVELIDIDYIDFNVFATCELNNYVLLTLDIWSDIYPSMKTCQMNLDYTVPYGLVYSLDPSKEVQALIETAQNLLGEGYFGQKV